MAGHLRCLWWLPPAGLPLATATCGAASGGCHLWAGCCEAPRWGLHCEPFSPGRRISAHAPASGLLEIRGQGTRPPKNGSALCPGDAKWLPRDLPAAAASTASGYRLWTWAGPWELVRSAGSRREPPPSQAAEPVNSSRDHLRRCTDVKVQRANPAALLGAPQRTGAPQGAQDPLLSVSPSVT